MKTIVEEASMFLTSVDGSVKVRSMILTTAYSLIPDMALLMLMLF
jgi:hypothetical protein